MQEQVINLVWNPLSVERGGQLFVTLKVKGSELLEFDLNSEDGSYFSLFEVSLLETVLEFTRKISLESLMGHYFREIENYLRMDNTVKVSKNDDEGTKLIGEFQVFLAHELIYSEVSLKINDVLSHKDASLVDSIKSINLFLDEAYNQSYYVNLFKQSLKFDTLSKGKMILIVDKLVDNLSYSLINRIFLEKFGIKEIKLVAGHNLTS